VEGELYITGRKKDLIIVAKKHIRRTGITGV